MVKNNPNIKPAEIQSTIVLSAFRNQMDWRIVEKEAASIVNRKQISNIKQKIRAETEPHGHNFEAIVNFKEYCDAKDKLYVFKINDRHGNPDQPSFVFKSSEAKMKLAVAMDHGKKIVRHSLAYFFFVSRPPHWPKISAKNAHNFGKKIWQGYKLLSSNVLTDFSN